MKQTRAPSCSCAARDDERCPSPARARKARARSRRRRRRRVHRTPRAAIRTTSGLAAPAHNRRSGKSSSSCLVACLLQAASFFLPIAMRRICAHRLKRQAWDLAGIQKATNRPLLDQSCIVSHAGTKNTAGRTLLLLLVTPPGGKGGGIPRGFGGARALQLLPAGAVATAIENDSSEYGFSALRTNSALILLRKYTAWPENIRWTCPSGGSLGSCPHFLSICPRACRSTGA